MASKEKEGDTTIMLTEQDIPGAELPKPPENCTVAILKQVQGILEKIKAVEEKKGRKIGLHYVIP